MKFEDICKILLEDNDDIFEELSADQYQRSQVNMTKRLMAEKGVNAIKFDQSSPGEINNTQFRQKGFTTYGRGGLKGNWYVTGGVMGDSAGHLPQTKYNFYWGQKGNTLYISPKMIVDEGTLKKESIDFLPIVLKKCVKIAGVSKTPQKIAASVLVNKSGRLKKIFRKHFGFSSVESE